MFSFCLVCLDLLVDGNFAADSSLKALQSIYSFLVRGYYCSCACIHASAQTRAVLLLHVYNTPGVGTTTTHIALLSKNNQQHDINQLGRQKLQDSCTMAPVQLLYSIVLHMTHNPFGTTALCHSHGIGCGFIACRVHLFHHHDGHQTALPFHHHHGHLDPCLYQRSRVSCYFGSNPHQRGC